VVIEPAGRPEGLGHPGGTEIAVLATQLTGTEHDRIFRKFADYAANYDAYRGRTDRHLRVFELTRR
jgi:F420H(2)-dependent quinone reductase